MNVIDGASLLTFLACSVAIAIALAVAASYLLRPRLRARFQGGSARYLLALLVQATAFITPIPIVWILLLGRPIPPGVDVLLGIAAGVALVTALRYVPVTGPLLKDLARARLEAALDEVRR